MPQNLIKLSVNIFQSVTFTKVLTSSINFLNFIPIEKVFLMFQAQSL